MDRVVVSWTALLTFSPALLGLWALVAGHTRSHLGVSSSANARSGAGEVTDAAA